MTPRDTGTLRIRITNLSGAYTRRRPPLAHRPEASPGARGARTRPDARRRLWGARAPWGAAEGRSAGAGGVRQEAPTPSRCSPASWPARRSRERWRPWLAASPPTGRRAVLRERCCGWGVFECRASASAATEDCESDREGAPRRTRGAVISPGSWLRVKILVGCQVFFRVIHTCSRSVPFRPGAYGLPVNASRPGSPHYCPADMLAEALSAPPKVMRPRTLMRYASRPGWRRAARSPDTSSPSGPSRLSRSPTCRRRPYGDWP